VLQEFGLRTYFLAVSPAHYIKLSSKSYWKDYVAMSRDLGADERSYTAQSKLLFLHPEFWTQYPKIFFRSAAYSATLHTRILKLPDSVKNFIENYEVKTIVCNYYFNLPVVTKIEKVLPKAKLVLETQDIQSYHYLNNHLAHPIFRTRSSFESIVKDEMEISGIADVLVHYSETEAAVFRRHIGDKQHHVIFPTLQRSHSSKSLINKQNVFDFLIVASANDPNYNSIL
jgi:hypothetical protein